MITVPFELKHLDMLDKAEIEFVPVQISDADRNHIICGKTVFDGEKVVGIGFVSLIGVVAVAYLMVTEKLKKSPLYFIKAIKSFLLEVVNEGYIIIASTQSDSGKKFICYLGFAETGTFKVKNIKLTRYKYDSRYIIT